MLSSFFTWLGSLFAKSQPTPQPQPTPVTPTPVVVTNSNYIFIIEQGNIRATSSARVRKEPTTVAALVRQEPVGSVFPYSGYVTNGEAVSGISQWFKTVDGGYVWAGAVVVSDASPTPTPTPIANGAITAAQLQTILSCSAAHAQNILAPLTQVMEEFAITTPIRQAAFIAQTAHESIGFTALRENLNYSATALTATWPSRFPTDVAAQYARQPEKIANRAYANRLGNGDEGSGDGWRYRGRGIIQVTGKDNYRSCGATLGLDLVSSPELLEDITHAFRSGGWFWNNRSLNALADQGDFLGITKKINGGTNGLADRERYYARAKATFGIS